MMAKDALKMVEIPGGKKLDFPQPKLKAHRKGIILGGANVHIKGFGSTPNPTSKKH